MIILREDLVQKYGCANFWWSAGLRAAYHAAQLQTAEVAFRQKIFFLRLCDFSAFLLR